MIKDGAYVIEINDKKSKGTDRVSLFIDRNTDEYFDSFGIEYIPQEILDKIRDKKQLTIYLKYKTMILLFWILMYRFHRIYACRKNLIGLH